MEKISLKSLKLKKLTLAYTILALFINASFLFAQVKLIYNVKYLPDTLSTQYQEELMGLVIKEKETLFYNETKFRLDSLYDAATQQYLHTGIAPNINIKNDFNIGNIHDRMKGKMYLLKNLNSKTYRFEDEKFNRWTINKKEKKTILGYDCYKAVGVFGGRKWIAWYTPDIPIPEGPYRFMGLDGLILEVADTENHYTFTAVSIEKIKANTKIRQVNFINTSKKEYEKFLAKHIEDPAMEIRAASIQSVGTTMRGTDGKTITYNDLIDAVTREFREFQKTHNNPIEKGSIWIR